KKARATYQDENKRTPFVQEDAWEILRSYAKWDVPEPVDLTEGEVPWVGNDDLFGEDARPRPAGLGKSTHPSKKSKFDTTTSTRGSNSSNPFGEHMSTEFHLKREAAEKAYEVSKERSYAYAFGGDEISPDEHEGFVRGRRILDQLPKN
nr:hypothetical protein [Tanacetum cinerariifolium]